MVRPLFIVIAFLAIGALHSPAEAATHAIRCEDRAANCIGRCLNPGSGSNSNRCMWSCDQRVKACLISVHMLWPYSDRR